MGEKLSCKDQTVLGWSIYPRSAVTNCFLQPASKCSSIVCSYS